MTLLYRNSLFSRQHPIFPRSASFFQILGVFLLFSTSRSNKRQCWMKWWVVDSRVLQQRDGTSTVVLLTQFTSTKVNWLSASKPFETEETLMPCRRERPGVYCECWKTRLSVFSWHYFTKSCHM